MGRDLAAHGLVLLRRGAGVRDAFDLTFERPAIDLTVVHETTQIHTLLGLIEVGLGISVLPSMLCPAPSHGGFAVRPLRRPSIDGGVESPAHSAWGEKDFEPSVAGVALKLPLLPRIFVSVFAALCLVLLAAAVAMTWRAANSSPPRCPACTANASRRLGGHRLVGDRVWQVLLRVDTGNRNRRSRRGCADGSPPV